MLCLFISIKMEFIYNNVLLDFWGSENYTGGTTEFSKLIYCGRDLFTLKVQ